MKAILEFDLDDYDDTENFAICSNARQYRGCLFEIKEHLRYHYKHTDLSGDVLDEVEKIRQKLFELIEEHNVAI